MFFVEASSKWVIRSVTPVANGRYKRSSNANLSQNLLNRNLGVMKILPNLIVISSMFPLVKSGRGKCDFPTLHQVCHLCRTLAKQEISKQNKSMRTKVACVGLVNHKCCDGLYIFSADISKIFLLPGKRNFQSISLGFMWSFEVRRSMLKKFIIFINYTNGINKNCIKNLQYAYHL